MKKIKKILLILSGIICVLLAAGAVYVNDYYRAEEQALDALQNSDTIHVYKIENDTYVFEPENIKAGLIFYPGGKVEYTAYAPLLRQCAEKGILCILPKMPFQLAVLDMNAADGVQEFFPEVEEWYIGGHSLGGSMAAAYLENHADEYEGLVLCAAYSTADLSTEKIKVLSIYGSNDGVLNMEKYNAEKSNLPVDMVEKVMDGGCHAYFGMYGVQKGDGTPEISNEEQIKITVDAISDMIDDVMPLSES